MLSRPLEIDLPLTTTPTVEKISGPMLSKEHHGGEKPRVLDYIEEMRQRMQNGTWRIHEPFGSVVCASSVGEAHEGEDPCTTCRSYLAHIGAGQVSNDRSLRAALKLRDTITARTLRQTDAARVQGELVAVRQALAATETKLDKAESKLDKAHADLLAVTAKFAAAEEEIVHLKDEREDARDEVDDERKHVDELKDRIHELQAQIEHMDEGRVRKRALPPSDVHVPATSVTQPSSAVADVDIQMVDVRHKTAAITVDWRGSIEGLPGKAIESYSMTPRDLPPAKGTWAVARVGIPKNIAAWKAAYEFCHRYQSWPVALAVFHVYVDARNQADNQNPLTEMHRYAILHYFMPVWFFSELKRWCADRRALDQAKKFWSNVTKPTRGDPIPVLAAFCQVTGRRPEGFHFEDDYGTIDSRKFRGALVFEAIVSPPIVTKTPSAAERDAQNGLVQELLCLLAVPGAYKQELHNHKCAVSPEERLEKWPSNQTEPGDLTTEKLVSRLSRMGLTVAIVDDMVVVEDEGAGLEEQTREEVEEDFPPDAHQQHPFAHQSHSHYAEPNSSSASFPIAATASAPPPWAHYTHTFAPPPHPLAAAAPPNYYSAGPFAAHYYAPMPAHPIPLTMPTSDPFAMAADALNTPLDSLTLGAGASHSFPTTNFPPTNS
ncbi:hypothetical protein R3P38DRAFT_3223447 [Favolaschia claudopus]|uniref:Uncharacterized protein n=1 Tax=Favolaschia claudopus TaxID=2862362 RepID=A0AAV9ZWH5_9AGAR